MTSLNNRKSINLVDLYYYLFLATFAIILFSNVIPSNWITVTRLFVFPTAVLSIVLIDSKRTLIFVLFFFTFICIYSLYPLLTNDVELNSLIKNTRYPIYFILIFGLVNIMKIFPLREILYRMSQIYLVKQIFMFSIIIDMNFGAGFFSNYFLNSSNLLIARLEDSYRILDIYSYFFPLAFIYLFDKKNITKILIFSIIFFVLYHSNTYGFLISFMLVLSFKYKFFRRSLLIVGVLLFVFLSNELIEYFNTLAALKSVSIDVKLNQVTHLIDNMSFFGQGLGVLIDIQGRVDSMLENTFIYWIIIYGAIGSIVIFSYFVFLPSLICYKLRYKPFVIDLFYLNMSLWISTSFNPFLESNVGIIPMLISISFYINYRRLEGKKGVI